MIEELTPTHITQFNGLWNRGPAENTPLDHFQIANNLRYINGGFETRYGTSISIAVPAGVRRFFPYSIEGQADRIIYLDLNGYIYDSLYPGQIILAISGMEDFSMIVMNDRAYLSPHNGIVGMAGQNIWMYQGGGAPARLAGGNPPSDVLLDVSNSPDPGYVEEGLHYIAVAYETDSGFITKPGPIANYISEGQFKGRINNLPIGPTGTIARHILATKTISQDVPTDGDLAELFFVEGASIFDNITGTADFEFYDSQLVRSADYLKDEMTTIPAVLGFTTFAGSLVGWAPNAEPSSVYVSKAGEPESISLIEGGIEVEPFTGGGVKNCVAYRGSTLMIHKSSRVYSTANNGNEPVYWEVTGPIESGIGTSVFGVATIMDEEGNTVDRYVFASKKGLIAYDGTFANVLSEKIDDVWGRITKTAFSKIQVSLDAINEVIYVLLPLDGAVTPNVIAYCDYSNGMTVKDVRWSLWTFRNFNPSCLGIDVDDDGEPVLKIGSLTGNIYYLDPTAVGDNLIALPNPTWQTAYVGPEESIAVNYYGGIRLRIFGSGVLDMTFSGLDDAVTANIPSIVMNAAPGRFPQSEFNIQSQKGRLKGFTDTYGERFKITRITIYHSAWWVEEPS
jgi:hypothetical protein